MLSQKRYYGFVTFRYNEIHKLHNHSNDASCNSAFYYTGWYYKYRETFRHRLTAESRLHIAMYCRHRSLVKLCGLKRIKFYDPHTSADRTVTHHAGMGTALSAYVLSCRPPTSSSPGTGRMLIGQSTNETTWAVSDATIVTVTWN